MHIDSAESAKPFAQVNFSPSSPALQVWNSGEDGDAVSVSAAMYHVLSEPMLYPHPKMLIMQNI